MNHAPAPQTLRILAEFVPQAWIRDYAYSVDPAGETTWDVTDTILAMGKDQALALRDDRYESDDLRNHPNAPAWVQGWHGPFYVRVAEAIQAYFEAQEAIP